MWLLSLSILVILLNKIDCAYFKRFYISNSYEVESIKFVQSLMNLIEAKKNIIPTEIGIVSALNGNNEHQMERIIEMLLTSTMNPIPWTIIQGSKYIRDEIMELLKHKTLLIFFVEKVSLAHCAAVIYPSPFDISFNETSTGACN